MHVYTYVHYTTVLLYIRTLHYSTTVHTYTTLQYYCTYVHYTTVLCTYIHYTTVLLYIRSLHYSTTVHTFTTLQYYCTYIHYTTVLLFLHTLHYSTTVHTYIHFFAYVVWRLQRQYYKLTRICGWSIESLVRGNLLCFSKKASTSLTFAVSWHCNGCSCCAVNTCVNQCMYMGVMPCSTCMASLSSMCALHSSHQPDPRSPTDL